MPNSDARALIAEPSGSIPRVHATIDASSAVPTGSGVRGVVREVKADFMLGDPAGDLGFGRSRVEDRPAHRERALD